MAERALRSSKDVVLLNLRVAPGDRETSLEGRYGERALKLKVAAPPVDGKANAEIERFLSGALNVSCSRISVVNGAAARDKVVLVRGVALSEVQRSLTDLVK